MTWFTAEDVETFLHEAGTFLASDPVANSVLLTEADFWSWLPQPEPGARFGWWVEGRCVGAVFVDIPDHPVLCSPLTAASVPELPTILAGTARLGVDARDEDQVVSAWAAQDQPLRPRAHVGLLRLSTHRSSARTAGAPRLATPSDLPVLRSWFTLFQERHPEDPSQVEFVVDHPLEAGSIVLWEVHGRPVAMASWTPAVAGMVRMGLAFQPDGGTTYADAAFAAGCVEAARTAQDVLVLSGSSARTTELESLGFVRAGGRVVLE